MTISPLQLARVPNSLSASIASSQLTLTQQDLLSVEQQLSTGKQFSQPSEDLSNASITMQLQRTLGQQQTYLTNLGNAQSQLGQVDNSLNSLTTLIQQAKTIASADVNSSVTSAQRTADAQIIDSIYNQALSIANTQSSGLYVFGGDKNTTPPYVASGGGVQFVGSSTVLTTTVDSTTNVAFMIRGADVFGATSSQVKGTANLTPALTANTRLTDLHGANGAGVSLGSIQVSNGATVKTVDLSHADNVGDVITAINNAGVGGVTAAINGQGIKISGGPTDNISITNTGGNTTANDLGIFQSAGAGAGNPVIGASTQPGVTVFTPLSALKNGAGIDPSGLTISNGTSTAHVSLASAATVGDLLNAINGSGTSVQAEIDPSGTGINIINPTQGLKMSISENGGTTAADLGLQSFNAQTALGDLNGGKGVGLAASGNDLQITRTDGTTFGVSLAGAQTVQDVIDKINAASGSGSLVASFSAASNGIQLTDSAGGGGTLSVTPANASTAAADLGLTQSPASGNTLTGSDVNPITATGLFANLRKLRDALTSSDQTGITEAAGGLATDYNNTVQSRGIAGAQVQEMQSRTDQIKTQNTTTQSLMSQLSDTDFTAAITRFQSLQTSLQATLQTTAKTLQLSLVNFLG